MSRRGFVLALAGLACSGCAGYQLGSQSLYPPDIHTVYVPIIESDSFRRYLGERLTDGERAVLQRRCPK